MHFVLLDKDVEGRERLKVLLRLLERRACVTELGEWDRLPEMVANRQPDLVLVNWSDMAAPLDAVHALLARHPTLRLVLTCEHPSSSAIRGLLLAGVRGVIPRSHNRRQMLCALELIMLDGHYVPVGILDIQRPPETARESAGPDWPARRRPLFGRSALSPRQQQILRLLTFGATNKSIARKLGISEGTVKIHMAGVFRALGVPNRAAAVGMYNAWLESGNVDGLLVADSASGALTVAGAQCDPGGRPMGRCADSDRSPTRASATFREAAPHVTQTSGDDTNDDATDDAGDASDASDGDAHASHPAEGRTLALPWHHHEAGTADRGTPIGESDGSGTDGAGQHDATEGAAAAPSDATRPIHDPHPHRRDVMAPALSRTVEETGAEPTAIAAQVQAGTHLESTGASLRHGNVQRLPRAVAHRDLARRTGEGRRHWPANRFRVVRARRPALTGPRAARDEPQPDDADDANGGTLNGTRPTRGARSASGRSSAGIERRSGQRPGTRWPAGRSPVLPLTDNERPSHGGSRRKARMARRFPLSPPRTHRSKDVRLGRGVRGRWRNSGRGGDGSGAAAARLPARRRVPAEKRSA